MLLAILAQAEEFQRVVEDFELLVFLDLPFHLAYVVNYMNLVHALATSADQVMVMVDVQLETMLAVAEVDGAHLSLLLELGELAIDGGLVDPDVPGRKLSPQFQLGERSVVGLENFKQGEASSGIAGLGFLGCFGGTRIHILA
jgi:hypothetical protein